jgi:hypothetical protein
MSDCSDIPLQLIFLGCAVGKIMNSSQWVHCRWAQMADSSEQQEDNIRIWGGGGVLFVTKFAGSGFG